MLLVASETGHVYTFATKKLQPMITSESGKVKCEVTGYALAWSTTSGLISMLHLIMRFSWS